MGTYKRCSQDYNSKASGCWPDCLVVRPRNFGISDTLGPGSVGRGITCAFERRIMVGAKREMVFMYQQRLLAGCFMKAKTILLIVLS